MPATTVCAPFAPYITVPPQVFPVGIGVLPVASVLMVPLFAIVDEPPNDKVLVLKSNVPPAVVVNAPFTVILPLAVSVPLVLLKVKLV